MRIGLDVAQQRLSWDELVRRAALTEQAGFDGIWGFDHFQAMYGEGPGECFEGYTTLAALAPVTSSARLGLLVTGVTYRHPSLLASQAITVDHASGGRLELSLGAAWFDKEHVELGFPFPLAGERISMLDEALTIIRGLFTTDDFSFDGRFWQLENATLHPRPVQQPSIPIWVAASGEKRSLPLAAKHADAWHTFGDPESWADKSAKLDAFAEAAGRDPRSILRAASLDLSQSMDDIRRNAQAYRVAGAGYLICGWPSEGEERLMEFAGSVLAELQQP